jgi:L-amino acid N-acyltransferase YncA
MTGYFALPPRSLAPDDAVSARALVHAVLGASPYVARIAEVLARAERAQGSDREHRALIIARDGVVAGLALYGDVAGAEGVVRVHAALLREGPEMESVGQRLMDALIDEARGIHARLLIAELPDEPPLAPMMGLLLMNDFAEEARIPDFFRDGVALVVFRRPA